MNIKDLEKIHVETELPVQKSFWRRIAWRLPLLGENAAWDLGLFVWKWKRVGPFIWYREMLSLEGDPPPIGPWCFAVFLSRRAISEFNDGACK